MATECLETGRGKKPGAEATPSSVGYAAWRTDDATKRSNARSNEWPAALDAPTRTAAPTLIADLGQAAGHIISFPSGNDTAAVICYRTGKDGNSKSSSKEVTMAGLGDLLSVLMQGGLSSQGNNRAGSAMDNLGQSGGVLGQILGGATASASGAGNGGGGLLGSLLEAAGGMMTNSGSSPQRNKTLTTGGLGALAGALLGGDSGALKGALGGGGMALLASLAMQAFKNMNQQPAGAAAMGLAGNELPLGMRAPANVEEEQALESTAELALKGMINAVKADGKIDEAEAEKLTARLQDAGVDEQDRQQFLTELRRPLDLDGLVAAIPNEAVAAQVYAASLFAITVDTPAEREYMAQLAQRSGLNAGVVKQLHTAVGIA